MKAKFILDVKGENKLVEVDVPENSQTKIENRKTLYMSTDGENWQQIYPTQEEEVFEASLPTDAKLRRPRKK